MHIFLFESISSILKKQKLILFKLKFKMQIKKLKK